MGTGLGLATVYGIVNQHQGWIEVESHPGQGTTFRVFLPANADAQSVTTAKPAKDNDAPPRGQGETILVVEDEPAVRKIIVRTLMKYGYHILEADCANAAVRTWESTKQRIHLLLTDMVMPNGPSGSELAAEFWKRDNRLKVIYASGYSPELVDGGQLIEEGINFLPKPYSFELLLKTVRRALDSEPATEPRPASKGD
jgi:two-component system cell cycle sensor histidine kinase/response regulator CckA